MTAFAVTGAGGIRLACEQWGEAGRGPAVVLLHGAGQTRHAWRSTAERLHAAGHRVVTCDHRGHGDSQWAANGYAFDHFAEDVRAIAQACAAPPVLVGASLGGVAALLAEGETPGVATALVLVDVALRPEVDGLNRVFAFMAANPDGFASLDEAAECVARFLPGRGRARDTGGLARNLRTGPDGRLRWHWDPELLDAPAVGNPLGRHARCLAAARRLTVPTLFVRGQRSEIVSEAAAREFVEAVPHAQRFDVGGATHMVAGDDNAGFTAAILDFLARTLAPRHEG